jgi:hypothetical protein
MTIPCLVHSPVHAAFTRGKAQEARESRERRGSVTRLEDLKVLRMKKRHPDSVRISRLRKNRNTEKKEEEKKLL